MKPVKPGHKGGNFRPIKEDDLPKIHESVLQVLEDIGMEHDGCHCIFWHRAGELSIT